tara:strand:- start:246 stop:959 length:714 start_codon:yes stop_codon:yes gene_type:complete
MNIENNTNNNSVENYQIIPIMPEAMAIFQIDKKKHQEFKAKIEHLMDTADDKYRRDVPPEDKREFLCNNRFQNVLLDFPDLKELHSILEESALDFIKKTGFTCDQVVITDAWVNKYRLGSTLPTHRHANSYISGNYFINYDKSINSPLTFTNDRVVTSQAPAIKLEPDKSNKTPYNRPDYSILCDEGTVLLWKSHLLHGYSKPEMGDNRLTLSFNVMPKIAGVGEQFSFAVEENNRV